MSDKLINQENYEMALAQWNNDLGAMLSGFKSLSIPVFEIINEPPMALKISMHQKLVGKDTAEQDKKYILNQCELKTPDAISFVQKSIEVKHIKQTKIYAELYDLGMPEELKVSLLNVLNNEINFLNSIVGKTGYFVYLHYSNSIFRFNIGSPARFEIDLNSPWADDDEYDDFEETEFTSKTPEELEAARIEADRKCKALDDRILSYAEELIGNKKFALVKSKKQCIQFMSDTLGERLSNENGNVIELIAQKALHLYEFEYLPREVAKLKDSDPREIADQLGITLPKVKKLLGMV
jgi:hypothetical protein